MSSRRSRAPTVPRASTSSRCTDPSRPALLPRGRPGARIGRVPTLSAGLLLYRRANHGIEVLIGHMGGPFWARKDAGGWSVPKGEHEPAEDARAAALREFEEELGAPPPAGDPASLGEVKL